MRKEEENEKERRGEERMLVICLSITKHTGQGVWSVYQAPRDKCECVSKSVSFSFYTAILEKGRYV